MKAVFIVLGGKRTKDKRHRCHVLQAVVTIRRIGECAGFGNNPNSRIVGGEHDFLDIGQAVFHLRMERHGGFTGGLSVKLSGEGDLKQNVLHHVAAKLPLKA